MRERVYIFHAESAEVDAHVTDAIAWLEKNDTSWTGSVKRASAHVIAKTYKATPTHHARFIRVFVHQTGMHIYRIQNKTTDGV